MLDSNSSDSTYSLSVHEEQSSSSAEPAEGWLDESPSNILELNKYYVKQLKIRGEPIPDVYMDLISNISLSSTCMFFLFFISQKKIFFQKILLLQYQKHHVQVCILHLYYFSKIKFHFFKMMNSI